MSVLASAKRIASARLSAHSRYRASNWKLVLNRRRVSNRKQMLIRKRVILVPILLEAITSDTGGLLGGWLVTSEWWDGWNGAVA